MKYYKIYQYLKYSMLLGIVGGMGPNATISFLHKLNDLTPIKSEQDHIPFLLISTPEIPDRSSSLLSGDDLAIEKIGDMLIRNVKLLESSQVTHIIMTCNTAHYWEDEIKHSMKTPFLSIIEETCKHVTQEEFNNVCVLSTMATRKMKLYDKYLPNFIYPNDEQQKKVADAIYLIKKKDYIVSKMMLTKVVDELKKTGCKYFITACTELPIVLVGDEFIDPCKIIVDKINTFRNKK